MTYFRREITNTNKMFFLLQLHQKLLGLRQRLTHIEIAHVQVSSLLPNSTQTALTTRM